YLKSRPSDYVLLFKKGRIKRQGAGLSFFYHAPTSSLVIVPSESRDTPFIFNEATRDFQSIDIQGQVTYRVVDATTLAHMLDFTIDSTGHYTGDGLEKLPVRLTNLVQVILREKLSQLSLREALIAAADLVSFARDRLKSAPQIKELGLDVLDFSILKISPTPEISKALEAATRENLLKEADDAIYQRRNFAVEQERKIKENELQTEIAVEEKNRLIREEQMNIEISVQEKQKLVEEARMEALKAVEIRKAEIEEQKIHAGIDQKRKRKDLVQLQTENMITRSRARADALKHELSILSGLQPDLVEALVAAGMDSRQIISRAMRELSRNAEKIGT
ncbi:MAG: band 7 protein, partial [Leptospiraceae bacterium]|nr:band 7 protein [Leptospiraceae bacterium]